MALGALVFVATSAGGDPTLVPEFPPEDPSLVYVEAEDAVMTNFTNQPTLDYGSSGFRTVQLNKGPDTPGAPFFAEFVVSVESGGEYELWVGGTPPGALSTAASSYVSPLSVVVDDGAAHSLSREEVQVVQQYSLVNYWWKAKASVSLTPGSHTLRFVVDQRRRYDNNYYFSLDAFFLLKAGATPSVEQAPALFPLDRTNRAIDVDFRTINRYEYLLQSQPKTLSNYLELAKVYSLVGEYQNALKVLAQAQVNVGESPELTLMLAKNRVWSGDWAEGLELYRSYLKAKPDDLSVWSELAKVLAWLGQYSSSFETYRSALQRFPDDLSLRVNYGLTYLWANRVSEGESQLDQAFALAQDDPTKIAALGHVYLVNGYPDKAIETYQRGTGLFPNHLNLYLLLEEGFLNQAQSEKADEVEKRIRRTFQPSARLDAALGRLQKKATLKKVALDSYQELLRAQPDNASLRERLIQAYFWNGDQERAIVETRQLLVNRLFLHVTKLEGELEPTYRVLDLAAVVQKRLADLRAANKGVAQKLSASMSQWKNAGRSKDPLALPVAETALAQSVQEAEEYLDLGEKVLALAEELPGAAAAELEARKVDDATLAGYSPWKWDRKASFDELRLASGQGSPLADALLARFLLDDRSPSAKAAVAKVASATAPLERARTWVTQGVLWTSGNVDADRLRSEPYYGYAGSLGDTIATLTASSHTAEFSPDTPGLVATLIPRLQALPGDLDARGRVVGTLQAELHQRIERNLEVTFYRFDLDTLDLRYQLGSYLLDRNRFEEARVELGRALAIRPQNVYVQYDLGRARQLTGDWSGAMELYRSIYQTNPRFEFTASSYNQLARVHRDQLETRVTGSVDPSRDSTVVELDYHLSGSALLSLDAAYTLENLRIYRWSTNVVPGSIHLQTAAVKPQVQWAPWNLSLYGLVGGTFRDGLLSATLPSTSNVEPWDTLTEYLEVEPLLGFGGGWSLGPLGLSAGYTQERVKDTYLLGATPTYARKAEGTLKLFFALPPAWWVQSVGSRSYVQGAELSEGGAMTNRMIGLVQEVSVTTRLWSQPPTSLTLSALGSYDTSTNPEVTAYYSPDGVLVGKGLGQFETTLGLGGSWSLGLVAQGALGLSTDPSGDSVLNEGGLSLKVVSGDLAVDLGVSATRANQGGALVYWTTQGRLGFTLGLPNYIIR